MKKANKKSPEKRCYIYIKKIIIRICNVTDASEAALDSYKGALALKELFFPQ